MGGGSYEWRLRACLLDRAEIASAVRRGVEHAFHHLARCYGPVEDFSPPSFEVIRDNLVEAARACLERRGILQGAARTTAVPWAVREAPNEGAPERRENLVLIVFGGPPDHEVLIECHFASARLLSGDLVVSGLPFWGDLNDGEADGAHERDGDEDETDASGVTLDDGSDGWITLDLDHLSRMYPESDPEPLVRVAIAVARALGATEHGSPDGLSHDAWEDLDPSPSSGALSESDEDLAAPGPSSDGSLRGWAIAEERLTLERIARTLARSLAGAREAEIVVSKGRSALGEAVITWPSTRGTSSNLGKTLPGTATATVLHTSDPELPFEIRVRLGDPPRAATLWIFAPRALSESSPNYLVADPTALERPLRDLFDSLAQSFADALCRRISTPRPDLEKEVPPPPTPFDDTAKEQLKDAVVIETCDSEGHSCRASSVRVPDDGRDFHDHPLMTAEGRFLAKANLLRVRRHRPNGTLSWMAELTCDGYGRLVPDGPDPISLREVHRRAVWVDGLGWIRDLAASEQERFRASLPVPRKRTGRGG